jgi:type IV pilus assembly protein PilM
LSLKKVLNLRKDKLFGLDIGSSSVKVIVLRKDESGYTVTGASILDIASARDYNHLKSNTVKAIRACMRSGGIKSKLAVCGVSGQEVAVRDFEFPFLPANEIAGAVKLEASQVCPFNASDSAVDYQLITDEDKHTYQDGNDKKTKGVLVAATNTLIRQKVLLAREARLKCVLMDVDGLALLNCFWGLAAENDEPAYSQTTAILNVGASQSTLAIMDNKGRPFIRDMTYAGNHILDQIASECDIPVDQAKKALFDNEPEMDLRSSFKRACEKLIADVAETLRFYSAQGNLKNIDILHVCGGFATAKGFIELLNEKLSTQAVIWNPFDKIKCDKRELSEEILSMKGPAMAVAAGLAMRSI